MPSLSSSWNKGSRSKRWKSARSDARATAPDSLLRSYFSGLLLPRTQMSRREDAHADRVMPEAKRIRRRCVNSESHRAPRETTPLTAHARAPAFTRRRALRREGVHDSWTTPFSARYSRPLLSRRGIPGFCLATRTRSAPGGCAATEAAGAWLLGPPTGPLLKVRRACRPFLPTRAAAPAFLAFQK